MNILVTSPSFIATDGVHKELLNKHFKSVESVAGPHNSVSMMQFADKFDGIICGDDEITSDFIRASSQTLKVVSKYGIGLDKIDIAALEKNKIKLYNCAGVNSHVVAEHAMGLVIAGLRNFFPSIIATNSGIWNRLTGRGLSQSCVGIVGYGNVGRSLRKLLQPLVKNILVYDVNFKVQSSQENCDFITDLGELFSKVDVICLCVSLNPTTRGLVNHDSISQFKEGMILVNVSRGDVVEESAILNGLETKKLKCYLTDVMSDEYNFTSSKLVGQDGIYITPHIASRTMENIEQQGLMSVENLLKGFNIL